MSKGEVKPGGQMEQASFRQNMTTLTLWQSRKKGSDGCSSHPGNR